MKNLNIYLLFILIWNLNSCKYDTDEIYKPNLTKSLPPKISTIILNLEFDTIKFIESYNVDFHFDAGDYKIYKVQVLIDGLLHDSISNYIGSFSIKGLSPGIHQLQISIITNSNTGSIADKSGVEGFRTISKEWVLQVYNSEISSKFIQASYEENRFRIEWEYIELSNFKTFIIKKTISDQGKKVLLNSFSHMGNLFYDSTYIGEKADYEILIQTVENNLYPWAHFSTNNDIPQLHYKYDSLNVFSLSFAKTKYDANISLIQIFEIDTNNNETLYKEFSKSDSENIILNNLVLGEPKHYKLIFKPNNSLDYNNTVINKVFSSEVSFLAGFKSEITLNYYKQKNDSEFFNYSNRLIQKYSITSEIVKQYFVLPTELCYISIFPFLIYFSPKADYFVASNGCYSIIKAQTNTNKVREGYMSDYNGTGNIIVADNGFGIVPSRHIISSSMYGLTIYNLNNAISSYNVFRPRPSFMQGKISSDAKYFLYYPYLYKFENDTVVRLQQTILTNESEDDCFIEFDPININVIHYITKQKLISQNAEDGIVINSFVIDIDKVYNVDYYSRKILAKKNNDLIIYNLDNGDMVRKIPLSSQITSNNFFLIRNIIYCNKGIKYFLN